MGRSVIEDQKGFTLIEALVSVAIFAIGFAGVYALVGVSDRVLQNSVNRQQLNFQANEIVETLNSDPRNIAEYHGKNLGRCSSLSVSKGKDEQLKRLKRWCERSSGETGEKKSNDQRRIQVIKKSLGNREVNVASIELTSNDGKNTVTLKRTFNAD